MVEKVKMLVDRWDPTDSETAMTWKRTAKQSKEIQDNERKRAEHPTNERTSQKIQLLMLLCIERIIRKVFLVRHYPL